MPVLSQMLLPWAFQGLEMKNVSVETEKSRKQEVAEVKSHRSRFWSSSALPVAEN